MSIDELPFQLSLARRKQTGAPGGFETCRSEFRIPFIPTQQNAEVSAVERADSQTHGLNGGLRCNQPREWNEAIRASPKRLRQILARSDKGGTIVKRRARVSWVELNRTLKFPPSSVPIPKRTASMAAFDATNPENGTKRSEHPPSVFVRSWPGATKTLG